MEFNLDGQEYIELKDLLKVSGLCDTGGTAKVAIAEGLVQVDGEIETRKGKKIRSGQTVLFDGHAIKVLA